MNNPNENDHSIEFQPLFSLADFARWLISLVLATFASSLFSGTVLFFSFLLLSDEPITMEAIVNALSLGLMTIPIGIMLVPVGVVWMFLPCFLLCGLRELQGARPSFWLYLFGGAFAGYTLPFGFTSIVGCGLRPIDVPCAAPEALMFAPAILAFTVPGALGGMVMYWLRTKVFPEDAKKLKPLNESLTREV